MKTKFEILGVTVVNREDAQPPTKLSVSYKGWWHLPLLHVPLALDKLKDKLHITRKAGQIILVQQFPTGKAPTFRVKGRDNKLEIRLHAGSSLRARAKVILGDLMSITAERLMEVPFKENVGGKVASAFLSVAQIFPVATPPPPHPPNTSPSHSLAGEDTPSPPSQDCVSRDGGIVTQNEGILNNTATGSDPVINSYTHSSQTAEEVVYEAPQLIPLHQNNLWPPQIAPAGSDDDFRRLWVEVFGDHTDPLHQPEHDEKGTQQSPQIAPGDCDADFVRLWSEVFDDQQHDKKGIRQSPQISSVDCDGHSFQLWKWNMGLSALWNFAFRLFTM